MGFAAHAQTNSWTSSTSGNWEDANWSLAALPGTNQTIVVTNHGWKAVAIGPNTSLNFPATMSIGPLEVTSPGTDTVNTVMLNYAGFTTPFVVGNVHIGTNAQLVVLQSALNGGLMTVDGTVIQGALSRVTTGLTLSGTGIYDLTNGVLNGGFEYISGRFHQEGGSNYCFYLGDYGGDYELLGGDVVVSYDGGELHGNFIQSGGTMNSYLAVGRAGIGGAYYELSGGMLTCPGLEVPGSSGIGTASDSSLMLQTGGTNLTGNLNIGADSVPILYIPMGFGRYTLTNGVLVDSAVTITGRGSMLQYGGVHSNANLTTTESEFFDWEQPGHDSYTYYQHGYYILGGGLFAGGSVNLDPGDFSQSGGVCQITNLEMSGGLFTLSGGQLTVSNISLSGGANFLQTGGTLVQSGIFTLAGAELTAGPGMLPFGQMQLTSNSVIALSPGESVWHFANSSGMTWSNAARLIITNWNGSLAGGGLQQVIFGQDNTGLTSNQLGQVTFANPAGVVPGMYPAVILPNGEIIPDPQATASKVLPPQLTMTPSGSGAMQVQLQGAAGRAYVIQTSSNLIDWTPWTNEFNTNGTFDVMDAGATNCPQRFYRAVLQP